jgi:hypothetical protein
MEGDGRTLQGSFRGAPALLAERARKGGAGM